MIYFLNLIKKFQMCNTMKILTMIFQANKTLEKISDLSKVFFKPIHRTFLQNLQIFKKYLLTNKHTKRHLVMMNLIYLKFHGIKLLEKKITYKFLFRITSHYIIRTDEHNVFFLNINILILFIY